MLLSELGGDGGVGCAGVGFETCGGGVLSSIFILLKFERSLRHDLI